MLCELPRARNHWRQFQAGCEGLAFSLRQFRISSLRSMRLLTLRPVPEASSSTWTALLAFRVVMVDRLRDVPPHLNAICLEGANRHCHH